MPQFAVYRNPGRNQEILFVLQVQATRLDRSIGRVIMPLIRTRYGSPPDHPLTPHILMQGQIVYANPLDIATVPVSRLGDVLEILLDPDQNRIIRSIDEMVSRA